MLGWSIGAARLAHFGLLSFEARFPGLNIHFIFAISENKPLLHLFNFDHDNAPRATLTTSSGNPAAQSAIGTTGTGTILPEDDAGGKKVKRSFRHGFEDARMQTGKEVVQLCFAIEGLKVNLEKEFEAISSMYRMLPFWRLINPSSSMNRTRKCMWSSVSKLRRSWDPCTATSNNWRLHISFEEKPLKNAVRLEGQRHATATNNARIFTF